MSTTLVQLRCASLRSKSSYGAFGYFAEEHAELLGATTAYWCLKTMGKAGPDDHYVHRSICTPPHRSPGSRASPHYKT